MQPDTLDANPSSPAHQPTRMMNTDTPRLSNLLGTLDPHVCQSCGGSHMPGKGNGLMRTSLSRWQEHYHHDQRESKVVVLCSKCAARLIEPHPRLYRELQPNEPWPGCMDLCLDCRLRDGIRCTSPLAKYNGGPGVPITVAKPFTALVDGSKYRGPVQLYKTPAEACKVKEKL